MKITDKTKPDFHQALFYQNTRISKLCA